MTPLRILRSRTVADANVGQIIGAGGMFGSFFLGSLYLEHVQGYGPLELGLAFLPVTVLMGALSVRYSEPDRCVSRRRSPRHTPLKQRDRACVCKVSAPRYKSHG